MNEGDNTKQSADNDQVSAEKKRRKVNIERYKDPEGLSIKKMEVGLWLLEHRRHFISIITGFLIFIAVVTWGYVFYGLGSYLLFGMKEDSQSINQLMWVDNISHENYERITASDLVFFTPQILLSSQDKYDFMVQLKNINENYWAEFEYFYGIGANRLASGRDFILPNDTKYVISLANELDSRPNAAQFYVENIYWHRLDAHQVPDWEVFKNDHLDIEITDIVFTPAQISGLSDRVSLNNLEFSATNNSAFSYWSTDFTILLYSRGTITGINQYTIDEFLSGETRNIVMSWPGQFSLVNKVDIIPSVNILDDQIYIKPEGGTGYEK
jgi:hypothetical protein